LKCIKLVVNHFIEYDFCHIIVAYKTIKNSSTTFYFSSFFYSLCSEWSVYVRFYLFIFSLDEKTNLKNQGGPRKLPVSQSGWQCIPRSRNSMRHALRRTSISSLTISAPRHLRQFNVCIYFKNLVESLFRMRE